MLREALEAEVGEQVAQAQRHLRALDGGRRLAGIEVEGEHRRPLGLRASESDGCSSSAASWASQTSVGRSSQTMNSSVPTEPISIGAVFTQSGVCLGARFSKKRWPSTPSGNRTRVSGRPARWGRIVSAIRA